MEPILITGFADDLMCVEKDGKIKSISLVNVPENDEDDSGNYLDVTITSISEENKEHELIDKLLGHKLQVTIKIVD